MHEHAAVDCVCIKIIAIVANTVRANIFLTFMLRLAVKCVTAAKKKEMNKSELKNIQNFVGRMIQ